MELGSLGQSGDALLARENVIETYVSLARSAPTVQVQRLPEFTICTAPIALSFCNFAIGLKLTESKNDPALGLLVQSARQNAAFRVFVVPGDEPESIGTLLGRAGFAVQHRLSQLALREPPDAFAVRLEEAHSLEERRQVARFMVAQFFREQVGNIRERVELSTAKSPHRLLSVRKSRTIVGAAMLSETRGVLGLYNLCVDKPLRSKGVGTAILADCCRLAAQSNAFITLQADTQLSGFYTRRGASILGEIKSFALDSNSILRSGNQIGLQ